jgi:hypothetical protein
MNRSALIVIAGLLLAIGAIVGVVGQRLLEKDRYQIVISPHLRADTFLLDTTTGRVWTPTQYTSYEGDPKAWSVVPRLDNREAERTWLQGKTLKEEPDQGPN